MKKARRKITPSPKKLHRPTFALTDREAESVEDRLLLLGTSEDARRYLADNSEMMMFECQRANRILRRWKKTLLSGRFGEVTGFGVELYTKRGYVVMPPQYCIVVSVNKKTPPKDFLTLLDGKEKSRTAKRMKESSFEEIPRRYPENVAASKSVRVKVVEANCRFASPSVGTFASGQIDPPVQEFPELVGGIAISKENALPWGTLGIVFPTKAGVRAITCHHVIKAGKVLQPPFDAIRLGAALRTVGTVSSSHSKPVAGIDACLIQPEMHAEPGVLDLTKDKKLRILVDDSSGNWSSMGLKRVATRGARTGHIVTGEITNHSFSITIDGKFFNDLIKVHAVSSSSDIVDEGDSGAALLHLLDDGTTYVWIGIVVGMIDSKQLVACKLPACLHALGLTKSSFQTQQLWKLP